MEYAIKCYGKRCICPRCNGTMTGGNEFKMCRDCGSKFKAVGLGLAENEVVFKEVKHDDDSGSN